MPVTETVTGVGEATAVGGGGFVAGFCDAGAAVGVLDEVEQAVATKAATLRMLNSRLRIYAPP